MPNTCRDRCALTSPRRSHRGQRSVVASPNVPVGFSEAGNVRRFSPTVARLTSRLEHWSSETTHLGLEETSA